RAAHDVIVDAVLGVRRGLSPAPQPRLVRLVLAAQQRRRITIWPRITGQDSLADAEMVADQLAVDAAYERLRAVVDAPRPRVAEPDRRQDVARRLVGPGVADVEQDEQIFRRPRAVVGADLPV